MKFIKTIFILITLIILLNNCSTLSEAGKVLTNEKKNSSDEFLIKKKQPLSQPPDFETIPEPDSATSSLSKKKNNIEEILKSSQSEQNIPQKKSTSTEQSILNKIKK